MSTERYVLRDVDNRDDSGAPWETSAFTLSDFIGYVDGALRNDLTDNADTEHLDEAIEALRRENFPLAEHHLREFGVYLRLETVDED